MRVFRDVTSYFAKDLITLKNALNSVRLCQKSKEFFIEAISFSLVFITLYMQLKITEIT